jgi:hypothetical protein
MCEIKIKGCEVEHINQGHVSAFVFSQQKFRYEQLKFEREKIFVNDIFC